MYKIRASVNKHTFRRLHKFFRKKEFHVARKIINISLANSILYKNELNKILILN